MIKSYTTQGTCASRIDIEVEDGIVTACRFYGGCVGNAQGIARLVVGCKADEVIARLKGIKCRNGTSCPDQLARALADMTH